jgi:hypothetical protein
MAASAWAKRRDCGSATDCHGKRPNRRGRYPAELFPAGRWAGRTAVVAASGPSLTKDDLDFCRGKAAVIVVNATFQLAPWADVLYGADYRFWQTYYPRIIPTFTGELWSVSAQARDKFGTYWINHEAGRGFNGKSDSINGGGNSGFQALHLAATFGATRIILLGFDMQRTGGKSHWHGDHIGGLHNGNGFPSWIERMGYLARDLAASGVTVLNCSRATALRCFPKAKLEDCFDKESMAGRDLPG